MKTIVCELCEGTSFTKQGDMYVCNSCNAQFSVEDVKKMMREVEDEAPATTTSSSSDFDKYILLARRASSSGNDADAAKYFGLAQTENPNDWESLFYSAYHTAMQTNIAGISSAAALVVGAIDPTVALIKNSTPASEQLIAANKLVDSCISISTMLVTAAINHYNGIDSSIRSKYKDELNGRATSAHIILTTVAFCLEKDFGDNENFNSIIGTSYKSCILMKESNSVFDQNISYDELCNVAKYDREFAAPRLQKMVASIDASINKLSKKTTANGCLGLFLLVFAAGFAFWGMNNRYIETYCFVVAAFFGIPGLLCMIPFRKSKKRLAQDAAEIEKLEAQKEEILDLIEE